MKLKKQLDLLRLTTFEKYKGKKVVLLHPGRCGSTVLTNMLHEYNDIDWQKEAFKASRSKLIEKTQAALFSSIKDFPVKRKTKHFGFEMKPMHLRQHNAELEDFSWGLSQEVLIQKI